MKLKRRGFLKLAGVTPLIAGVVWAKNKFHIGPSKSEKYKSVLPQRPDWVTICNDLGKSGLKIVDAWIPPYNPESIGLHISGYSREFAQRFLCTMYISQTLMEDANFNVTDFIKDMVFVAAREGPVHND